MRQAGWLRSAYLTRLSHPAQDRRIYQTLFQRRVRALLEIGMGTGLRTGRMLEAALHERTPAELRYIGVDLFEAREKPQVGLTVKQAHQLLSGWGVSTRLIPGDAYTALSRTANSLGPVDLVVISAGQNPDSLGKAWFYLPRLLHAESQVFLEEQIGAGTWQFRLLTSDDLTRLARCRGCQTPRVLGPPKDGAASAPKGQPQTSPGQSGAAAAAQRRPGLHCVSRAGWVCSRASCLALSGLFPFSLSVYPGRRGCRHSAASALP